MRIFLKRNMVKRYFHSLPRHISGLLIFAFLFASIVSIGTSVFLSPALAEAQGSEKAILHRHHPLVQEAIRVKHRHLDWLMRIPGVVGSGVGIGSDGLPVIKVLTSWHGVAGIPEWLESTPVHVEVTGMVVALDCPQGSAGECDRPVPIGVSTGHPAITAGTIGARVKDSSGRVFALSNNHVYANQNDASLGDIVLQPGTYDGGIYPDDKIGELYAFQPIDFSGGSNTMDAAIALSSVESLGNSTPEGGYGTPSSQIGDAFIGLNVQKYGRTTGLTHGTVSGIDFNVQVCYEQLWIFCTKSAYFSDQIEISGSGFSGGGDSGSLIVTDDGNNKPVGLLFAGSDTTTFANRIDLVLNAFGVTIDDGVGTTPDPPNAPSSLTATAVSSSQINLAWADNSDNEAGFKIERCTGAGCTDFTQIATVGANITIYSDKGLSASATYNYRVSAYNSGGDSGYTDAASATTQAAPDGVLLELRKVVAHTDSWTLVQLDYDYGDKMVVVCSPNYDLSAPGPAIARVRNAQGSSFEVGIGRPWYGTFGGEDFSAKVYCMVLRQGVYSVAEDGVKMEAVKLPGFTLTDHAGSWSGQHQVYQNAYTRPVVVGQVVSPDAGIPPSYCPLDPEWGLLICELDWSVFWSRGTKVTNPPSSNALYVGRHTGEDTNGRGPETLMYVVIESGTGTIETTEGLKKKYVAALGGDTVRGMQNRPPFNYSLSGLASASVAIISQAGMDGADGGWPVLYGPSAVSATRLRLAIDEDWYMYSERNHTTEQVSYIVFE
jgi:Fibronectin type III domain